MTRILRPSPPARSSTAAVRRSRSSASWWVAATVVGLAGLVVGVAWAAVNVLALGQRADGFGRSPVPGTVVVDLARGERAVVYIEAPDAQTARAVEVSVRGADGAGVTARPYAGTLQYDVHDADGATGRLGYAVRGLVAPAADRYTVTASSPDADSAGTTLAVGEDLASGVVVAVLAPALLALGMVVLAGVLVAAPVSRSRRIPARS